MGSTFLQHFAFVFFLLLCGKTCESQKISSFSSDYANHHNACTRKLVCLIAARPDGESYEEIRQGFDYFFGGLEDVDLFKSERFFLDEAWNIGRQFAPNNQVCSHLNTTHSCPMSSERLMETFDDIYEGKNVIKVCERKRSACFNYYIGTYGLCGGAWIVAGVIGTATCNIITIPRTIDCTINAWFNCLAKDCGFVGFK